jgi:hypothetical protein
LLFMLVWQSVFFGVICTVYWNLSLSSFNIKGYVMFLFFSEIGVLYFSLHQCREGLSFYWTFLITYFWFYLFSIVCSIFISLIGP